MFEKIASGDLTMCQVPIVNKVVKCGTTNDMPVVIGIMVLFVLILLVVIIVIGIIYQENKQ